MLSSTAMKLYSRNTNRDVTGMAPGFTLIEVMTAVTILALMAAITYSVVFSAVKRSRYIDRISALEIETQGIGDLIIEDIRGAFIQEGVVPFFLGDDKFYIDQPTDRISLLTTATMPVSPYEPSGGISEVTYSITETKDGQISLFRREQLPQEPPFDEGGGTFEITDRIKSLNLSYSDGEDWFDEWDSQGQNEFMTGKLPKLVRIELILQEEDTITTYKSAVSPVLAVGR